MGPMWVHDLFIGSREEGGSMSTPRENLDQSALRLQRTVIPFLKTDSRFDVSSEASFEKIDQCSLLLQAFVQKANEFEEAKAGGQWTHVVGMAREAATTIISTWAELTAPQMNDGSLGEQEKNLVARIDAKILELQFASTELEHYLTMGMTRFISPESI